ncbi:MAG: hypothetical protein ACLQFR_20315 [Streptosporangiaceae bacterium]
MTLRSALTTAAATLTAAGLTVSVLSGCGSTPASVATRQHTAPAAALPMATSLIAPGGAAWAVAELGGPSARHDNFWELLARPAGATAWTLATPPGVASNGGLILASAGTAVIAGFRPSQLLTFSPLAATADQGKSWSQGNLVSPGLAAVPDALAAGPDDRLLALTDTGTVRLGAHLGASWSLIGSRNSVARSPAGRACGLTSLSAVAFSSAGTPMAGGSCRTPGVVGLFAATSGGWQPTGLALPAALGHVPASVLGLATFSGRTTALLAVGHGPLTGIVAAWSGRTANGGWTFSPVLRTGTTHLLSQSLWLAGAVGIVLAGSHGETLALGPAGQLEALTAHAGTVSMWQLGAGSGSGVTPAGIGAGPASWKQLQTIKIQIPYGSSG